MKRDRAPRRRSWAVGLLATAVLGLAGLAAPAAAYAIPPGGATPDTPGTSSTVAPATLAAGERITFSVAGFPAGETINIKIDDGEYCSEAAVHGACVVHVQRIRDDGTVSGDFLLPADLPPGDHWLRYLSSTPILDAGGNPQGVAGFTLRGGSDFTVVAPEAEAPPPAAAPEEPAAPAGAADAGAGAAAGGGAAASDGAIRVTAAPTTPASPSGDRLAVTETAAQRSSEQDGGVVWILTAAVVLAVAGGIVIPVLLRRPAQRRQ